MRVAHLNLLNFRNIDRLDHAFDDGIHVISGENGHGKTNTLEALSLCSRWESFRTSSPKDWIKRGHSQAIIQSIWERLTENYPITIQALMAEEGVKKSLCVNEKRISNTAQHRNKFTSVIFAPKDVELVSGAPSQRRDWMDSLIIRMNPGYNTHLQAFDKTLRQRNRMLKDGVTDKKVFAVYDALLLQYGKTMVAERNALVERIKPSVIKATHQLFGEEIDLKVKYKPNVEITDMGSIWSTSLLDDIQRGHTTRGPSHDDLELKIRAGTMKEVASSGQKRSVVLMMKLAEMELLNEALGQMPVLLLDDVSSELDQHRRKLLFERIEHLKAQTFVTTTEPRLIPTPATHWVMQDGVLKKR